MSKRKFICAGALALFAAQLPADNQKDKQPQPDFTLIECMAVLVILVVAGYVIRLLIRFCDYHLGRGTNLPAIYTNITGGGTAPSIASLPPLYADVSTNAQVVLQSSQDTKAWQDQITCGYEDNHNGTVRVWVKRDGQEVISKIVPVEMGSNGAYAVADLRAESAGLFPPQPPSNTFRLLSAEPVR